MKLYTKLFNIQGKAYVTKDGENPHFRSKFMTLDNIVDTLQPYLIENKLLVTHFIDNGTLTTRVVDIETAETLDSHFPMNATDPQKSGSEISYWKRYNLVALFNICTDVDDDWNNASKKSVKPNKAYITTQNIKNIIASIKNGENMVSSREEALKLAETYFIVWEDKKKELFDLYSKELL